MDKNEIENALADIKTQVADAMKATKDEIKKKETK